MKITKTTPSVKLLSLTCTQNPPAHTHNTRILYILSTDGIHSMTFLMIAVE